MFGINNSPRAGRLAIIAAIGAAFALPGPARAGNPLFATGDGKAFAWSPDNFPVILNFETGGLGGPAAGPPIVNNTTCVSLMETAASTWSGLAQVNLEFDTGESLGLDVTEVEFADYFSNPPSGFNPMIFDQDGTGFDSIGLPPQVLGIAGPTAGTFGEITQGRAAIGGHWIGGSTQLSAIQGVMFHELGHFLGFGHAEVNGSYANAFVSVGNLGVPPLNQIETMYPSVSVGTSTPHLDDIAIASYLYPVTTANLNSISGLIYDGLGEGLAGCVVVARDIDSPFDMAVGGIAGAFFDFGAADLNAEAYRYKLQGLPDGSYSVNTQEPFFGAYSAPVATNSFGIDSDVSNFYPGPDDFYSGLPSRYDDPNAISAVSLSRGAARNDVDIRQNFYVAPRLDNGTGPEVEPNNTRFGVAPQVIDFGKLIQGSVGIGDAASNIGGDDLYEDFYRFTVAEAGPFLAELRQPGKDGADLDMILFTQGGTAIVFTGATAATNVEKVVILNLDPGTYVMGVSHYDFDAVVSGPVNYTFSVGRPELRPAPDDPSTAVIAR